jgi:hypothetical protein
MRITVSYLVTELIFETEDKRGKERICGQSQNRCLLDSRFKIEAIPKNKAID